MEGLRGEAVLDECKVKFLKTFILDCCYWLPVQVNVVSRSGSIPVTTSYDLFCHIVSFSLSNTLCGYFE